MQVKISFLVVLNMNLALVWAGKLPSHTICFKLNFFSSRPFKIIWFLSEQGNIFSSSCYLLQVKISFLVVLNINLTLVWAGKLPSHTICFRLKFFSSRPFKIIWFLSEQGNIFSSSCYLLQVKISFLVVLNINLTLVWAGKLPSHTICFRLKFFSSRPLKIIWFLSEQGNSFSCSCNLLQVIIFALVIFWGKLL